MERVEAVGTEFGAGLTAEGGEQPLGPRECQKYLQDTLAKEFRAIVAGFISEAREGGCAHMKLAVELLEAPKKEEAPPRRKGSAQRLLEELGE